MGTRHFNLYFAFDSTKVLIIKLFHLCRKIIHIKLKTVTWTLLLADFQPIEAII